MSNKKTLFLILDASEVYFFEKEGNYTHLNGVFTEYTEDEILCNELINIIKSIELPLLTPTKDWTYFVKCGTG